MFDGGCQVQGIHGAEVVLCPNGRGPIANGGSSRCNVNTRFYLLLCSVVLNQKNIKIQPVFITKERNKENTKSIPSYFFVLSSFRIFVIKNSCPTLFGANA